MPAWTHPAKFADAIGDSTDRAGTQDMARRPKPDFAFKVPLYGGWVFVLKDRAAWLAVRRQFPDAPSASDVTDNVGMMAPLDATDTRPRTYLVGWFDGKRSTLVHEMLHATIAILEYVGIDAADSRGEAACYLLDHLLVSCEIDADPAVSPPSASGH